MIATLEYARILDESEALGQMILRSEQASAYIEARRAMEEDQEAQMLIKAFNHIKMQYEDVQRFGRYHPDYNEIMRDVRKTKREMDMNSLVAAFKIEERKLQQLLDEVSIIIADSVSEQVIAPRGTSGGGCGCGSGGGCGCKVG
ncbi:YlbF family regulator [Aciduricibacillus chroicocephali]|uniref:YlbF family regulator n=1 Tax=Aciduricibacillus chroicocephali TaxID=3054939 RepID=A0ABY9KXR8_9BACI|nr:YlbF family regulator [Bacillaceae bacterium 44XB]